MLSEIIQVSVNEDSSQIVKISTDHGNLCGEWIGKKTPEIGDKFYVELDLSAPKDISLSSTSQPCAQTNHNGEYILVGVALSWNDGIMILQVGNALVFVDCAKKPVPHTWYEITGDSVKFFPVKNAKP